MLFIKTITSDEDLHKAESLLALYEGRVWKYYNGIGVGDLSQSDRDNIVCFLLNKVGKLNKEISNYTNNKKDR